MRTRFLTQALIAIVAALVLAGCGEKEEPSTAGPVVTQTTTGGSGPGGPTPNDGGASPDPASQEAEVEAIVTDFLTQPNDPSVCDDLLTPAFVKGSYGNREGCLASRKPSAMAESVKIEPLPGGPRYQVSAKPKGGVFGGQTLEVTIVVVDGQRQIDKITSDTPVGP